MVLANHDLNQVTWEQRALAGDPKFEAAQNVVDFPYSRYGEMLGFKGIRVDKPDDIGAAWDLALTSDRPVVIEVTNDPEARKRVVWGKSVSVRVDHGGRRNKKKQK